MENCTINNLKLAILGDKDIDALISLSESVGWDYDQLVMITSKTKIIKAPLQVPLLSH